MTDLTRKQQLALIYRHTHRDFRGQINGVKTIMRNASLVALDNLTDEQIAAKLPYALRQEAKRKAA